MKKTSFVALALSASLLLVACKPAEISKEEAAKRFENINNAFQEVETIDALTVTYEQSELKDKNGVKEESHGKYEFTSNVEQMYLHAYVIEDGKMEEDYYSYLKDEKYYIVDGVNKLYEEIDLTQTIDELKKAFNSQSMDELIDTFQEFSNNVADYFALTVNSLSEAIKEMFGETVDFSKNIFNLKYYSNGEGNLLIENSVDYAFSLEVAGQSLNQKGKTTGSLEFNDNLPTALKSTTTIDTTNVIANKTTNNHAETIETLKVNYNSKVSYPDLSDFSVGRLEIE